MFKTPQAIASKESVPFSFFNNTDIFDRLDAQQTEASGADELIIYRNLYAI